MKPISYCWLKCLTNIKSSITFSQLLVKILRVPNELANTNNPCVWNTWFLVWKWLKCTNKIKANNQKTEKPLFLLKEVKLHLTKDVSTIQTIEARWMTCSIEAWVSILGPVAFTKADLHKQAWDLKGKGRRFSHQASILWSVCWGKRGCETVEFEKNFRRCWYHSLL